MSLFSKIFGSVPSPANAAPSNNLRVEPNVKTLSNDQVAPNGMVPDQLENKPPAKDDAGFKDLWSAPEPEKDADGNVIKEITQDDIRQHLVDTAKKLDFKAAIPEADLKAIAAGGEGAIASLQNVLTRVMQTSFTSSSIAASELINQALESKGAKFQESMQKQVRLDALNDSIESSNAALTDPQFQPLVRMINDQLAVKYPKASVSQLEEMSKKYLAQFAAQANGTPAGDTTNKTSKNEKPTEDVNWADFFND